jgi:hypothetical protein
MDEPKRWRRSPIRSFALGATVGAAGTIATLRRLRRASGARTGAGLAAFEDAPCFVELSHPRLAPSQHDRPRERSES